MQSPYLTAHEKWHSTPWESPYTWRDLLEAHLQQGAVISTPTAFLMAWPCHSAFPERHSRLLSPLQFPEAPDCWHVWIAAGNLHELLTHASLHPLPFVSWHRRGGSLKIHRLSKLLASHDQSSKATTPRPRSATG